MGPFFTEAELARAMRVPAKTVRRLTERHELIPMRAAAPGSKRMYSSQMVDASFRPIAGLAAIYDVLHEGLGFEDTMVAMWLGGPFDDPAIKEHQPDLRSRMWHLRNGNFDGVYGAAALRAGTDKHEPS
jgi:hypothetical protein